MEAIVLSTEDGPDAIEEGAGHEKGGAVVKGKERNWKVSISQPKTGDNYRLDRCPPLAYMYLRIGVVQEASCGR